MEPDEFLDYLNLLDVEDDDTRPIALIVCEHTDSPWCPRCAGGTK